VSRRPRLVALGAAFYGLMLAAAIVWGWLRELSPHWWQIDGNAELAMAVVAGCALGGLGVALSSLLARSVPGIKELSERVSMVLAGHSGRDAILLALFSSVAEEALFRGCVQTEFGFWPATFLFAIVHIGTERVWLWWTASAFVAGIGLGLLYDHQGGLLAPILMHFVINAINIHLLAKKGDLARRETLSSTVEGR